MEGERPACQRLTGFLAQLKTGRTGSDHLYFRQMIGNDLQNSANIRDELRLIEHY